MNQTSEQAVVVPQTNIRPHQKTSRLSLFFEDGEPVKLFQSNSLPVNVLDKTFSLSGTTNNTESIQSAFDHAADLGLNVYFPMRPLGQPYMVGGSGVLIKIPPGVSISSDPGVVVKVINNNGDYKTIFGGETNETDLTNLVIENLTIDQNSNGNAVSDVGVLYQQGTQRFCIYSGAGSNITVRDCKFKNVDGLNTIYIGSPTMKDARVQDCSFDLVGTSPAWHDHSTLYLSCDGLFITGNKFRGVLGSNGATTAIETHGPNQIVTSNIVESYKIGANITGLTNLGNDGLTVNDNQFRNVLIGVQLWSWLGTNGGLIDVDVSHNRIHINRDPWTLTSSDHPRGICLNQSASGGSSLANVKGLNLSNNFIRFGSFSVSHPNDYLNASGIELVSQDSLIEIQELTMYNNLVVDSIGPSLRIGCKLRRAQIHDNVWMDPSRTSQALGSPAGFTTFWQSSVVATGNADFYDVKMWGNRTFDTRGSHVLVQGFATSLSTGNVTRCEEWDNTVVCSDGVTIPESSQSASKRFSARGVPTGRRLKSGLYHTAEGGVPTTLALAVGNEYAIPFNVGSQQSFNEIAANITVVGTAGALLRYGLRADDGNGAPGALISDFGTVTATTLAARAVTISKTFPTGLLWLTVTAQVAGCTVTAISGWLVGASGASSVAGAIGGRSAQYQTGVTGALPATFTSGGQTPNAPAIFVRAA